MEPKRDDKLGCRNALQDGFKRMIEPIYTSNRPGHSTCKVLVIGLDYDHVYDASDTCVINGTIVYGHAHAHTQIILVKGLYEQEEPVGILIPARICKGTDIYIYAFPGTIFGILLKGLYETDRSVFFSKQSSEIHHTSSRVRIGEPWNRDDPVFFQHL